MIRPSREDERGYALITALLASVVLVILATVVVQISMHNAEESANDRRRVQAIAAAEAGIDYYFSYLQSFGNQTLACSVTKTLSVSPPASFTVTPTFYDSSGTVIACPPGTGVIPASVLIRSVGKGLGAYPTRTMEAFAKLSLAQTKSFDNSQAIFGASSVSMSANTQVGGLSFSDANVYSNGSYTVSANSIVYGSIYAQGSVTLGSNAEAKRDVWAYQAITMAGNARIRGNATSSISSISMTPNSHVFGNARAGTTIATGIVDGYRTPNSPSVAPPARDYPTFTYVDSDWTSAGYHIHPYTDCSTVAGDSSTWWGDPDGRPQVVRVTGNCTLSTSITTHGNLAFVVDGNLTISTGTRFTPATGTAPSTLYFFEGLLQQSGCNLYMGPGAGADYGLTALIYTEPACTATIQSNSALTQGQIYAGVVQIKNSLNFQYSQPPIPGTIVGGFKEDVSFIREVT